MRKNMRGNLSLVLLGVVMILVISSAPRDNRPAYSQFAAAEPSAAEQIWQIGNQPVGYLQDTQTSTQIPWQGMWDVNSDYTRYLNTNGSTLNGQSDVWGQLNSEVQSSEVQIANNPLDTQSTFSSGPAPLASFEMNDSFANQPEGQSSWWSDTWNSVDNWGSSAVSSVEGWFGISNQPSDMNACPDGVCDTIGIRG